MPKKKHSFDFMDYDCDFDHRVLYLGSQKSTIDGDESGVDSALAEKAIKALYLLDKEDPEGNRPISIILNNPGGDCYHGMAIYDAIKATRSPVNITVFGMAMSMGSIILQAGDKRILAPNARVMIHHGYMGMSQNHAKIYEKWAEESKRLGAEMIDIYITKIQKKHPLFKRKRLDDMLNFDTILSSKEAVELGLADYILGEYDEKK